MKITKWILAGLTTVVLPHYQPMFDNMIVRREKQLEIARGALGRISEFRKEWVDVALNPQIPVQIAIEARSR